MEYFSAMFGICLSTSCVRVSSLKSAHILFHKIRALKVLEFIRKFLKVNTNDFWSIYVLQPGHHFSMGLSYTLPMIYLHFVVVKYKVKVVIIIISICICSK